MYIYIDSAATVHVELLDGWKRRRSLSVDAASLGSTPRPPASRATPGNNTNLYDPHNPRLSPPLPPLPHRHPPASVNNRGWRLETSALPFCRRGIPRRHSDAWCAYSSASILETI